MNNTPFHVVTGAFGYSGRFIARRLLDAGVRVRTLTNSVGRANPFGGAVEVRPLAFADPDKLTEFLRGVEVLYNTYWVRFTYGQKFSHVEAVRNLTTLFSCARAAGVGRIVHVSILNPSLDSPFEYFRGKAEVERALATTGVPHTILRPAVLFGHGDILLNNIAWLLRRSPVFGLFGDGAYRLRPIHVDDLAKLAVAEGKTIGNSVIDAVGPDRLTYRELVVGMARRLGLKRLVMGMPPAFVWLAGQMTARLLGDVVITWEEIEGIMANLLDSEAPPAGSTGVLDWVASHAAECGVHYASELARRRNIVEAYDQL